ncbi:MAG: YybH family protein [Alphaproteobacteria bacterium]|tara:strand:- start:506 stop:1015 length:510 start_codon:yes stop_codon:yes gene_type:complete
MIYKNFFKYTGLFLLIILSQTVFLKAENISNYNDNNASIKKLYETWHSAVESSNIDGYINSLDKNITLIPPGGPIISGAENYREFLGPVFKSATYKIQDGEYDIEVIGDIAIVRSRQTVYLTFKDNANQIQSEGALQDNITTSDYLDILKRQEDGSWKCLVHTWQLVPN